MYDFIITKYFPFSFLSYMCILNACKRYKNKVKWNEKCLKSFKENFKVFFLFLSEKERKHSLSKKNDYEDFVL